MGLYGRSAKREDAQAIVGAVPRQIDKDIDAVIRNQLTHGLVRKAGHFAPMVSALLDSLGSGIVLRVVGIHEQLDPLVIVARE